MEPTTPTGSRRTTDVWSPSHSAAAVPLRCRAAPAKYSALSIEPGTSNCLASRIGLPACSDSTAAYSSARADMSRASSARAWERAAGVARDQPPKARWAASTAASTSAGPASSRVAMGRPSLGSTTSCRTPVLPTTALPSIQHPGNRTLL